MSNVGLPHAGDSKGPAITEEGSKVALIWLKLYLNDLDYCDKLSIKSCYNMGKVVLTTLW